MRQGQQSRRGRGRSNNNNPRKGQNPLTRSFESNGPDVKLRGTPAHIAEKYMSLARDAQSAGDPVLAENYLQHAEHYNRIIMAYREQQASHGSDPGYGGFGNGHGNRMEPGSGADLEMADEGEDLGAGPQPFDSHAQRFDDRPQRIASEGGHGGRHPSGFGGQPGGPRERGPYQDMRGGLDRQDRSDRPDRGERFERRDRGEHRTERGDRFERRDRGDRVERMDRGERPERADRPERGPGMAGEPTRTEPGGMQRRRPDRPSQPDRHRDEANEQPEFLRRSVRRPRREETEEAPEAVAAAPVTTDEAGE